MIRSITIGETLYSLILAADDLGMGPIVVAVAEPDPRLATAVSYRTGVAYQPTEELERNIEVIEETGV